jgi:site-specific DNA-methyltransferase (adenine-specific)
LIPANRLVLLSAPTLTSPQVEPPTVPCGFFCERATMTDMVNLMQGDCLELMRTIPDGSVDMVLTDPPYGTTACKWDSVIPFAPMWDQLKRITKPNGAIVLTSAQPFTSALIMSNVKMFKYCWVWEKSRNSNPSLAKIQPLRHHEEVCVFNAKGVYKPIKESGVEYSTRKGAGGAFAGSKVNKKDQEVKKVSGRYPKSILSIKSEYPNLIVHPTQKPVALMEYLIRTYTNAGETVLDFTMGSGTTGVACKNLGRAFIGIELDADYFEICVNRINAAHKKEPTQTGMDL